MLVKKKFSFLIFLVFIFIVYFFKLYYFRINYLFRDIFIGLCDFVKIRCFGFYDEKFIYNKLLDN